MQTPAAGGGIPPGKPTTMKSQILDVGADLLQAMEPLRDIQQHVCTFALHADDLRRQIETHHFVSRLNQDVLQCAVYDSDLPSARLIGVEYIVSQSVFETLPEEEQRLWHSHAHEIKAGLWVTPRVPEMVAKPELRELVGTYGKFWCTWQTERGDRLPMGAPALMMSPQEPEMGRVRSELVRERDEKYGISSAELRDARVGIEVPRVVRPNSADYWMKEGKGFAVDVEETDFKRRVVAPTPSA